MLPKSIVAFIVIFCVLKWLFLLSDKKDLKEYGIVVVTIGGFAVSCLYGLFLLGLAYLVTDLIAGACHVH